MTIAKIQKDLKAFDQFARQAIKHDGDATEALQTKWSTLFKSPMSKESAKSFSQYYRKMVSKRGGKRTTRKIQKMRGGAASILSPATIDYQMVPGANVQMYGRFPVEADTDPSTIRDMDVYFNSGMSRTCGVENSARQVPAGMGSNKVGGSRRRRRGRTLRRRHAGGSLMESLQVHPYVSTAPPNVFQVAANVWSGNTASIPAPASPVQSTWVPASHGTAGLINPGVVTNIGSDFSKLASPPAWQSTH
jgi:hypothetical protein